MKRSKKTNKKNTTRNSIHYTPGRNALGEKAETHLIVLKKETAFQQIMDCVCQLDGSKKEFTFDPSCFTDCMDEYREIMAKVQIIMGLKARMSHSTSFDYIA